MLWIRLTINWNLKNISIMIAIGFIVFQNLQSKFFEIKNGKIYGGMIFTNPKLVDTLDKTKVLKQIRLTDTWNDTFKYHASLRVSNGRRWIEELPFPVEEWWGVFYSHCSNKSYPAKNLTKWINPGIERSVPIAHKQIWDNFLFEERFITDASPKDIFVIFEDDAYSVVRNIIWSLENEFKNGMNEWMDLTFSGWCFGNKKGRLHVCTHAYAYTREGLKKIN